MRFFLARPAALAAALALLLASCGGGDSAPAPAGSNPPAPKDFTPASPRLAQAPLLADLSTLADPGMEGRKLGTPGNAKARAFLVQRFSDLGLDPAGTSFEQPFTWRNAPGVNVVGRLRGTRHPERVILFSAHYDHIGSRNGQICPGADDNASGSAAVLQLAAWLKAHPPAHTVLFCLFDGEESGLFGSQAFVAAPPIPLESITVVLNLDMIAQGTQGRIFVGGTSFTASLRPTLTAAYAGSKVAVIPDFEAYDSASDQYPFMRQGIPFLFWCVGDDDPWYHTASDTFANIPGVFYWASLEAILETFVRLDAQDNLAVLVPRKPGLPADQTQWVLDPHFWKRSLGRGRSPLSPE
jgi:hypothetical protein